MKTKTTLKAGHKNSAGGAGSGLQPNHNQTLVRETTLSGLKTTTGIKAGVGPQPDLPHHPSRDRDNHCETLLRDGSRTGVKTLTHLKAGGKRLNHNETLVRA